MYTIHNEVVNLLKSLGYSPNITEKEDMVDIYFPIFGFDDFKIRHKDAIRMLAKGYLSEFYYAPGGIQHVYIHNECNGLEPDDGRYGCLLNEIKKVSSTEPRIKHEIFDVSSFYCKRYTNLKDFILKHVSIQ